MKVEDTNGIEIKPKDKVKATEDIGYGLQGVPAWKNGDDVIEEGEELIVDFIHEDKIFFTTIPDHYGGFEPELFEKIK